MTERERYRETDPERHEVYQKTVVDQQGVPNTEDASRSVYQERSSDETGDRVVRSEHISVPSDSMQRASAVTRIKQMIYFIFGVISVLILMRFVLLLLGASQASSFVQLIYGVSQPFVAPFLGIFGEPAFNASVVEWASLIGVMVYMLIAYGISRLVELAYAPAHPTTVN